jgi:hypothetical protein
MKHTLTKPLLSNNVEMSPAKLNKFLAPNDDKQIDFTFAVVTVSKESQLSNEIKQLAQEIGDINATLTALIKLRKKLRCKSASKYSIAFSLLVAIATLITLLINHSRELNNNLSYKFEHTLIPTSNSSCADLYQLKSCNNMNTTAIICNSLQKQACDVDVIGLIYLLMTSVSGVILLCSPWWLDLTINPSLDDIAGGDLQNIPYLRLAEKYSIENTKINDFIKSLIKIRDTKQSQYASSLNSLKEKDEIITLEQGGNTHLTSNGMSF